MSWWATGTKETLRQAHFHQSTKTLVTAFLFKSTSPFVNPRLDLTNGSLGSSLDGVKFRLDKVQVTQVLLWFRLSSGSWNSVSVWFEFGLSSVWVNFGWTKCGLGFDFGSVEVWAGWSSLESVWVRVRSKSVSIGFGYGLRSMLSRVEIGLG